MKLRLNESNIIWPGRLKKKPEGFMIPTHLKVLLMTFIRTYMQLNSSKTTRSNFDENT